ncbi:MAG: prepilin-type N-terminal cleavage/methylation domain-containing protein [Deferribacteraceae bacterium]|jgi:prepilin-type N-terminal cleavage/methylation domain-containing protein|nr:prepilin-type N-terminal cleavage/methylation domain-containing protein [Deferribacteraceae bacterium]
MLKKGFTIVELAIVLIIIGIIIGMAIKGGALLQTAKMRAEFRKIDKIRVALSTWRANNPIGISKYPPAPPATDLNIDLLVELGYLTEQETLNPFGKWLMMRGDLPAVGSDNISSEYGKSFILWADNPTLQYSCNFEVLLDDKVFDTGNNRVNPVPTAQKDSFGDWIECNKWPSGSGEARKQYYDVL